MIGLTNKQTKEFFDFNKVCVSSHSLNAGNQVSFVDDPIVTVRVYLWNKSEGEDDESGPTKEALLNSLKGLFSSEYSWILFPRYGSATDLISSGSSEEVASIYFELGENQKLVDLLYELYDTGKLIEYDAYVVAKDAAILAAWDHHIFTEGLPVKFLDSSLAIRFINKLSSSGMEFKVFPEGVLGG